MGTHYSHMTLADRISIQALPQAKLAGPAIALKLGFSRSAINREINRSKARPTALVVDYQSGVAQVHSQQRRSTAGACRRKLGSYTQSPLWRTVSQKIAPSQPHRAQPLVFPEQFVFSRWPGLRGCKRSSQGAARGDASATPRRNWRAVPKPRR